MRLLMLDTAVVVGGGQLEMLSLVKGLLRRDLCIHILATGEPRLASALGELGVSWRVWSVRSGSQRSSWLRPNELIDIGRGMQELMRAIRDFRPDLIYANSERAGLVAGLLPRSIRGAFVFQDRTLERRGGIVRWVGARSEIVIAVSQAVAAKHAGGSREDRVRVIPGGVDLSRFTRLPTRRDRAPMVFAFIGRMSPEKGPQFFLRAARDVVRSGCSARFVLCGQMPDDERSPLAREIRAHLAAPEMTGRVRCAGFVHDVAEFLEGMDVLVVPSLREGLGMSAVEALARGRPVIASRVGGLPEIVSDGMNGLLVEAGDAGELASAIATMVSDPDLYERLASNGPRSVERYSLDRMIDATLECFREALGVSS
jgi:glycosyltransferase involved in cell wall biosynthesis